VKISLVNPEIICLKGLFKVRNERLYTFGNIKLQRYWTKFTEFTNGVPRSLQMNF